MSEYVRLSPDKPIPLRYTAGNIYIAGPMTGLKDFNRPNFDKAAKLLRRDHWTVFNPVEYDIETYGEAMFDNEYGDSEYAAERYGFDRRKVLAKDLEWICLKADAMYMLQGWQNSSGARAEYATAVALGLTIFMEMYYPIDYKTTSFYMEMANG